MLKGWKTLALAAGVTILGALQSFDWASFVTTENAGYILLALGTLMGALRLLTDSPAGKTEPKEKA